MLCQQRQNLIAHYYSIDRKTKAQYSKPTVVESVEFE